MTNRNQINKAFLLNFMRAVSYYPFFKYIIIFLIKNKLVNKRIKILGRPIIQIQRIRSCIDLNKKYLKFFSIICVNITHLNNLRLLQSVQKYYCI